MLLIDISTIPPEGLSVEEPLDASSLHLEREDGFALGQGGLLACRLERADGNSVHVRGRFDAELDLECNRCLEHFAFPIDQEVDLFYLPHQPGAARGEEEEEDEVELDDHEMVVAYHDGQRLDLGEMVREQIFLSVPMKRLCREDCKGRCLRCGADLNAQPCGCPPVEDGADPRLLPLKKLFSKDSD
jgi:DUF177 domain-containing protein